MKNNLNTNDERPNNQNHNRLIILAITVVIIAIIGIVIIIFIKSRESVNSNPQLGKQLQQTKGSNNKAGGLNSKNNTNKFPKTFSENNPIKTEQGKKHVKQSESTDHENEPISNSLNNTSQINLQESRNSSIEGNTSIIPNNTNPEKIEQNTTKEKIKEIDLSSDSLKNSSSGNGDRNEENTTFYKLKDIVPQLINTTDYREFFKKFQFEESINEKITKSIDKYIDTLENGSIESIEDLKLPNDIYGYMMDYYIDIMLQKYHDFIIEQANHFIKENSVISCDFEKNIENWNFESYSRHTKSNIMVNKLKNNNDNNFNNFNNRLILQIPNNNNFNILELYNPVALIKDNKTAIMTNETEIKKYDVNLNISQMSDEELLTKFGSIVNDIKASTENIKKVKKSQLLQYIFIDNKESEGITIPNESNNKNKILEILNSQLFDGQRTNNIYTEIKNALYNNQLTNKNHEWSVVLNTAIKLSKKVDETIPKLNFNKVEYGMIFFLESLYIFNYKFHITVENANKTEELLNLINPLERVKVADKYKKTGLLNIIRKYNSIINSMNEEDILEYNNIVNDEIFKFWKYKESKLNIKENKKSLSNNLEKVKKNIEMIYNTLLNVLNFYQNDKLTRENRENIAKILNNYKKTVLNKLEVRMDDVFKNKANTKEKKD